MTTRSSTPVRPSLPIPGGDLYDPQYMKFLVDTLEKAFEQLDDPRGYRATSLQLQLQGFATNGGGLLTGEVFIEGGFLRVVRSEDVFAGPLLATASLGAVTVTT